MRRPHRRGAAPRRKVPVPRTKKRTRTYVRKNAMAVNSLSKQVRSLKVSQYGKPQTGFHRFSNHVVPIQRYPVLFDMLDYTVNHQSGAGTLIPSGPIFQYSGATLQAVATWDRANLTSVFWLGENTDTVDTGAYYATWMDYCIAIEGDGGLDDTRVRVDIFYQKPKSVWQGPPGTQNILLPNALNQFDNIATPELNQINPKYFRKVYTKVVYFNSRTDEPTALAIGRTQFTPNKRYVRFRCSPKKLIKQALTNPVSQGGPEAVIPDGSFGHLNTPVGQALWCLISTDDQSALTGDAVKVTISRKLGWRDPLGSSQL